MCFRNVSFILNAILELRIGLGMRMIHPRISFINVTWGYWIYSLNSNTPQDPGWKRLVIQPQLQIKFLKLVAIVCPPPAEEPENLNPPCRVSDIVPSISDNAASASASPDDNQCGLFWWNGAKYGWFNRLRPGMQVQTSLLRLESKMMSPSLHDVKIFLGWSLALHQALTKYIHHNKEDRIHQKDSVIHRTVSVQTKSIQSLLWGLID